MNLGDVGGRAVASGMTLGSSCLDLVAVDRIFPGTTIAPIHLSHWCEAIDEMNSKSYALLPVLVVRNMLLKIQKLLTVLFAEALAMWACLTKDTVVGRRWSARHESRVVSR